MKLIACAVYVQDLKPKLLLGWPRLSVRIIFQTADNIRYFKKNFYCQIINKDCDKDSRIYRMSKSSWCGSRGSKETLAVPELKMLLICVYISIRQGVMVCKYNETSLVTLMDLFNCS